MGYGGNGMVTAGNGTSNLTDEQLRFYLDNGMSQASLAKRLGVTRPAISRRVRQMKAREAAGAQSVVDVQALEPSADLWAVRPALDRLYARLERMADPESGEQPLQVVEATRRVIDTTLRALELLVKVEAIKAFEAGVLDALGEASPELRAKAIECVNRRRSVAGVLQLGK